MAKHTTAGLVVIGNEILSGKVADSNSPFLAKQLRAAGVSLERIAVIPDEVELIGETVRLFSETFDVVFTSGGVGPTHDDVTIAGVAAGLGRKVTRHPVLVDALREHFGDRLNEPRLRLAEVVEGTELVFEGDLPFPTFLVENIYVLPGIPEIFRDKVNALRQRLATDPFHLHVLYVNRSETSLTDHLDQTLVAFPELLLGSYPVLNDPEYQVRITLESKDQDYVERALVKLLELLPRDAVVRKE